MALDQTLSVWPLHHVLFSCHLPPSQVRRAQAAARPSTPRAIERLHVPVEGVQVMAYLKGSAQVPAAVLRRDTSDEDGAFRLDLPEECLVDLVTSTRKVNRN